MLRTTNTPKGLVLLKASRVVRIRGRLQPTSSSLPRKASPSPSPSPAKSARASPGKAARASPSPSPSNKQRWSGGGSTWVNPDAQQYLLVGDTLDFGVGGAGRTFRCRFSFTLYLASTVAVEPAGGGSSSGSGRGGGTKRRLEGTVADNSGDVHLLPKPLPAVIKIDDSSDDEEDGATPPTAGAAAAATTASPASAPAPAVPKRHRRDIDRRSSGGTPSKPVEVVDLCGSDAVPRMPFRGDAGTSSDQPLDLCMSDEEGDAGGPAVASSGARAAPIPPRGSGGGGCSSGGGGFSSSASPKACVEAERLVPPPARIDGDVPEPGVSRQEPRTAVPAAVNANLSLFEAASPTTIENDQPEPPPPSPPSSPFRSLRLEPSSPPHTPSPSPLVQEEKRSVSVPILPAQHSLVSPCSAAGGGGGGGAAGPVAELSTPPIRTRPRMCDDLRIFLKVSMRVSHEYTAPMVDEFLARGMAPHISLCRVVMAELLKSR